MYYHHKQIAIMEIHSLDTQRDTIKCYNTSLVGTLQNT